MTEFMHSPISLVHLLAALLALLAGTYVLFTRKGTPAHRRLGWVYAGSMVVLVGTAFQIYHLFGRFGIVHWGAIGSVVTLLVGLGAVCLRNFFRFWLQWHYAGMGASLTGLYAAFTVESTYRLFPPSLFWWATLGIANVIFGAGGWLLYHHYPDWLAQIDPLSGETGIRQREQDIDPANPVVYPKVI